MNNVLLRPLNPRHKLVRWPLKTLFLGLVVLFTLYPDPRLLARHIRHWSDLSAMIDPDEPALAPLVAEVHDRLAAERGAAESAARTLKIVEKVVYDRIPYAWDWDAWGCVDYLPTVAETLELGCEDCDGRAVVAASLLRRMGHEAQLVTDGSHMWVRTEVGETMSPMPTASGRTLVTTSAGKARVDVLAVIGARPLLVDWPKNIGFGIGVFPPGRVALIGFAFLLCLAPVGMSAPRLVCSIIFAFSGLLAWRFLCSDPWQNSLAGAWLGIGGCVLGCASASGRPSRLRAETPEGVSDKGYS